MWHARPLVGIRSVEICGQVRYRLILPLTCWNAAQPCAMIDGVEHCYPAKSATRVGYARKAGPSLTVTSCLTVKLAAVEVKQRFRFLGGTFPA